MIINRSQQSGGSELVKSTNQHRLRRKDEGQKLPEGMANGNPHSSASTQSTSTAKVTSKRTVGLNTVPKCKRKCF